MLKRAPLTVPKRIAIDPQHSAKGVLTQEAPSPFFLLSTSPTEQRRDTLHQELLTNWLPLGCKEEIKGFCSQLSAVGTWEILRNMWVHHIHPSQHIWEKVAAIRSQLTGESAWIFLINHSTSPGVFICHKEN